MFFRLKNIIYNCYLKYKVRVVFFEKNLQKISTLFSLYFKFRQVWLSRQAEHTQNEANDDRLGLGIIPAEPPELLSPNLILFQNVYTLF
ncbi:hypothetical protein CBE79_27455 [Priestia megaterium]|nr:hypothetical protein CBE79_27455 [Priestia megaterium]